VVDGIRYALSCFAKTGPVNFEKRGKRTVKYLLLDLEELQSLVDVCEARVKRCDIIIPPS
jgi:hypothetical protein